MLKKRLAWALLVSIPALFTFSATAAETDSGGKGQNQSTTIYSVSVEPAQVASGETILIEAVFSVFDDSSRSSLPMEYLCEIENQGEVIYKSPVKEMSVKNGAKSHLEINLQATGDEGDYKVALELILPDGNIREEGDFSIVSPMEARRYRAELLKKNPSTRSAIENRLAGKWQLIPRDSKTPGSKIVISNENGELTTEVSRGNVETLWVKSRKTENNLVIRSKFETPGGGCWYIMEDEITFNDRMDDMSVRSKVLEGNRCVSVGQVSEAMLHRLR